MRDSALFIGFLSDYGLSDEFVGICHGVIAKRCPQARVIDITHQIPPQDVIAGALTLRDSLPFLPVGVQLAVVDPGVGATTATMRRAVALRTRSGDRWLVGPDNGLLMPAALALGGVAQALDIGESPERLMPVSATFHGRDIFAPVAAALADGAPTELVGRPFDPDRLRQLPLPQAKQIADRLHAHVLSIDRFGNLALDATPGHLRQIGLMIGHRAEIEVRGQPHSMAHCRTFADVPQGALLIYEDSRGMVALAVNEGSAARTLGLRAGETLTVRLA